MRKPIAIIAALLMLSTGIVLGQLISVVMPGGRPEPANPAVDARSLETARAFYDDANAYLTNGDRAIESMLAPGFIDHVGSLTAPRNAEQLMNGLNATRAALPNLHLNVIELRPYGSLVEAELEIDPGAPTGIPTLPDVTYPSSRSVEFLRIDHSSVAERWSNDDRLPEVLFSAHADFDRSGPSLSSPAIERLSLAPDRKVQLSGRGTAVLYVISGSLWINQAGRDQHGETHPAAEPLAAGEIRIVDEMDVLGLRNETSDSVEFWAFSLYGLFEPRTPVAVESTPASAASGEISTLAYMPLDLPSSLPDRLRISVSQVILPPGTWIAPHTPSVVEQIVVLDGSLEATVQSGRALHSLGDAQMRPFEGTEVASAGQGFSASPIAAMSYRVSSAQSASLLIMTISPVLSAGTPEATSFVMDYSLAHAMPGSAATLDRSDETITVATSIKPALEATVQIDVAPSLLGMPDATSWTQMRFNLVQLESGESFTTDADWYTAIDGPLLFVVLSGELAIKPAGPAIYFSDGRHDQTPIEAVPGESVVLGPGAAIAYSAADSATGGNPGIAPMTALQVSIGRFAFVDPGTESAPLDFKNLDRQQDGGMNTLPTASVSLSIRHLRLETFDSFVFDPDPDLMYFCVFDQFRMDGVRLASGAFEALAPDIDNDRLYSSTQLTYPDPGPHTIFNFGSEPVDFYFFVVEPIPDAGALET